MKPPYAVPSMAAIRELPWNGFNAISTFSGCGGSSLGYRMAGFRILWASEFIDAARDSYRANKADYTILDGRDIREVTAAEILTAIKMQPGELDLFDGSPPCASFSTAGKREAGWGKVKKYSDKSQRTDDLFFEYTRLLQGLQPKVFVAENVSGLVKGAAKGYFLEILRAMKACGYRVSCRVLDAQWLGVPQSRQRTIFIGVREDLGMDPVHPKPLPYRYSVRDALPWIDSAMRDDRGAFGNGGPITNIPAPTVLDDSVGTHWVKEETEINSNVNISDIGLVTAGNERHTIAGRRPLWPLTGPSPTITATVASASMMNKTQTEKRKFTIAELRRICAFPDDFVLTGTYAQQWERLGRAVPPVMMSHIAATLRDAILAKVS